MKTVIITYLERFHANNSIMTITYGNQAVSRSEIITEFIRTHSHANIIAIN